MIVPRHITTAEQLERAGDIGRCELLRGELVMMSPGSGRHGRIAMAIGRMLSAFVAENELGSTYAAETGFLIERDPDTVRAPDVAFVRNERRHIEADQGFICGPPDLAVEVISPGDSASEVLDKVHQWLECGCESVWVADPQRRTISAYRKDRPIRVCRAGETLNDEPLLPGFSLSIDQVFAD